MLQHTAALTIRNASKSCEIGHTGVFLQADSDGCQRTLSTKNKKLLLQSGSVGFFIPGLKWLWYPLTQGRPPTIHVVVSVFPLAEMTQTRGPYIHG